MKNLTAQKLIIWGIVATAFTAFLISPVVFIPDKFAKAMIFRLIVEIMLIGGVFLWLWGAKLSRDNFGYVAKAVAAFFFAALAATLLSVQPNASWLGTAMRGEGFLFTIHLILFFFIVALVAKWEDWRKNFFVFSLIAGAVGVFVVLQYLFPALLNEPFLNSMGSRPSGTLGNPANLAGFMIIWLFVAAGLYLTEKNKDLKIVFALSAIFQLIAIILSETRGVFLGMVIGGWWFFFFYPGIGQKRKLALGATTVAVLFAVLVFSQPAVHSQIEKLSPKLGRVTNLTFSDDTASSRLMAWQIGLSGFADRPIFGYGPENFSVMFDSHFNPSFSSFAAAETWWDRAHNIFFDIGIPLGGVGFATYLTMLGMGFYSLRKRKIDPGSETSNSLNSPIFYHALLAALVAYFSQNLFNFDTINSWMAFFLILAFAEFAGRNKQPEFPLSPLTFKIPGISTWRKVAAILTIAVIVVAAWKINIQPFLVNYQSNNALRFINEGTFVQLDDAFDRLTQRPTLYDNELNDKYFQAFSLYANALSVQYPELFRQSARKAINRLDENIKRRPLETRLYVNQAGLYVNLAGIEPESVGEAPPYLEKAWELSPERQVILETWAKILVIQNRHKEALVKLEKSALINPNYAETFWWLATVQSYIGNFERGEKYFEMAEKKGLDVNEPARLRLRAALYRDTLQYAKLPDIYLKLLEQKSDDLETRTQLLIAYLQTGDRQAAQKQANVILQAAPSSQLIIDKLFREIKKEI